MNPILGVTAKYNGKYNIIKYEYHQEFNYDSGSNKIYRLLRCYSDEYFTGNKQKYATSADFHIVWKYYVDPYAY